MRTLAIQDVAIAAAIQTNTLRVTARHNPRIDSHYAAIEDHYGVIEIVDDLAEAQARIAEIRRRLSQD